MDQREQIIADYLRHEAREIAAAEKRLGKLGPKGMITIGLDGVRKCVVAAARECGVSYEVARNVMLEKWVGTAGQG
jgi:hypothetical protein